MTIQSIESSRLAVEPSLRALDGAGAWDGLDRSSRDLTARVSRPSLLILGIRGVPATHGGFETFAERFALHMVARGWAVTVYCQKEAAPGSGLDGRFEFDRWRGVDRVSIYVAGSGPRSTIAFDWRSLKHARTQPGVPLVLGYNTACFLPLLAAQGRPIVTNMDGVEWKRAKWSAPVKAWFLVNELIACALSTDLIADHPQIAAHLRTRFVGDKVTTIPYGADPIEQADPQRLDRYGLTPERFAVTIARIEPENSILQIVRAFSRRPRPFRLACLGALDPGAAYHRQVRAAASDQVDFPGAIYDKADVAALRRHALGYVHGHTVGGTNPSLVEALGAGCAVIAHRNKYNLWTAGPGQFFFSCEDELDAQFTRLADEPEAVAEARRAARRQHRACFTWERVLAHYEALCRRAARAPARRAFATLALTAFAALSFAALTPRAARADYLLGPGDKVKIEVNAAFVHQATVGPDGQIGIPQLGVVKVGNLTLVAAQSKIHEAFRSLNAMENPEVLIEVAEYRPFFIGGDVAKPGGYAYQPGLTARQAITLAGGLDMVRFRFGENPFLRAADLRSEYETLAVERLKLDLRRRRVQAELDGEPKLNFGDLPGLGVSPTTVRQIADLERDRFIHARDAMIKDIELQKANVREAQANLNALLAERKSEDEAQQQEERNTASIRDYVARGVVATTRLQETLRALASAKSRMLTTESQMSVAKRALDDAQRQLLRLEETRRSALLAEAQETAVALEKLNAQVKASAEKFAVVGGARSSMSSPHDGEAEVVVYRREDNRVTRLVMREDAPIMAGDTIEINLKPQRLLGLAADKLTPAER